MAVHLLDRTVIDALVRARIIDDPNMVRRVVIDIKYGAPPVVYVERFTDDHQRLADVIESVGIAIQRGTEEGGQ